VTRTLTHLLPVSLVLVIALSADKNAIANEPDSPESVPGEVVVELRITSAFESKRVAAEAGGTVERALERGFVTLAVKPGEEEMAIERLRDDPVVESAELNAIRRPHAFALPVDELYDRQWNMDMIQAPEAWGTTRGSNLTIAVLDTGVAFENFAEFGRSPQLAQTEFVFPYDATTGTSHPSDSDGHGTHVTGTLAQDWDAVGVAGLVPLASIMPVRSCSETTCNASDIADGVHWAVDHGADIINISLGGPTPTQVERDAFSYAEKRGVVVVASAGNGGPDLVGDPQLHYPARYETVISVGAVNRLGVRANYSNFGEHEGTGGVHVMAPGGNRNQDLDGDGYDDGILQNTYAFTCTEDPVDYKAFTECGYYGTSMAAPHVAGTAAILLSEHSSLSPAQVRKVISCSTVDLGPVGEDLENGFGLIQAADTISDWDGNGIVDCLDGPPNFHVGVDDIEVLPDSAFRLSIDASIPYPGLLGYQVVLSFEPAVADVLACEPREQATCERIGDSLYLSSEPEEPIWGNFRIAYVDMQALAKLNAFTSLHLQVDGLSARKPDIGLTIERDHGSVRISDPVSSVFGDLDCDNKVLPNDVITALWRGELAGSPCTPLGDVDCSGETNALDGIAILAYLGGVARPQSIGCPPIGLSAGEPPPEP
jgi:serine protease